MNFLEKYISTSAAPLGTVRSCRLCPANKPFFVVVRAGIRGVGRGYGMREGNKARGAVMQHIKQHHPTEYAQALKESK